jgi:hypothetical protein
VVLDAASSRKLILLTAVPDGRAMSSHRFRKLPRFRPALSRIVPSLRST